VKSLRLSLTLGLLLSGAVAFPLAGAGRSQSQAQPPPGEGPKGLMPNLGRPTKPDDKVPLFDFDRYFIGQWALEADAPDSVLGPGGVSTGTVTFRKLADGFYEALTEGKGEAGAFTIKELIAYHREQRTAFRHVTDSRGYSYVQMADVGGNIGGDYRLFFRSAPFDFKGKKVRLNHTVHVAAPLTFRVDVEVAVDGGPFLHMSPWRFRRVSGSP
jgi:hypothetical protein